MNKNDEEHGLYKASADERRWMLRSRLVSNLARHMLVVMRLVVAMAVFDTAPGLLLMARRRRVGCGRFGKIVAVVVAFRLLVPVRRMVMQF